ncbi:hypothetical protein GGI12_000738 [Dipsacomyces acuminosporus]|nr:hypothetical protein GGI12_000738 [Dipsacomyces acuminosporus]
MVRLAILAAVAAQAVNAQFKFDPKGYNASELYNFISAHYPSAEAAWNRYLSNAKASYTGAYPALTSFLGTATIPATFDPVFISNLAEKIYSVGPTTIVDPAVNPATLVFTRTLSTGTAANTGSALTPTPTRAVPSPATGTDMLSLQQPSTKGAAPTTTKNGAAQGSRPGAYAGAAAVALAFAGARCLF